MKIWKCLAVSKMIAASSVAETCWDLPVYPGLGLSASTCTANGLTGHAGTCTTTCASGTIAHTCTCKDSQNNAIPCKWTNVATNCKSTYQVKEFVIVWSTTTPQSASTFKSTTSTKLVNIFKKWISQKEPANKDKGESRKKFFEFFL